MLFALSTRSMLIDRNVAASAARDIFRLTQHLALRRDTHVGAGLILVFAAIGVAVLSLEFFRNNSLMMDECAICMNIFGRSLQGLSKTLDYDQAAPLGYLYFQKLFFHFFGMTDRTTRVLSFCFGLLTLPLALIAFRRVFPLSRSALALVLSFGLICLNRALASYSGISKQYTLECCATLALLYVFYGPLARRNFSESKWLLILSPVLVWLSFGSVFVLAGFGTALLCVTLRSRDKHAWRLTIWFLISAAVNFATFFCFSARGAMANQRLASMWSEAYMPLWPPSHTLAWLWNALAALGELIIHMRLSYLVPIALLATCVSAVRQRSWFWIGCLASVSACIAASALKKYPFYGRLALFLLPIVILMLGNAIDSLSPRWRKISLALTALIFLAAGSNLFNSVLRKNNLIDRVRQVHQAMLANFLPADVLWVAPYSEPCFRYYSRKYPFAPGATVHFLQLDEVPIPPPGRNWLLVMRTPANPSEGERLLSSFSRFGKATASIDVELTTARLFVVR